MSGRTVDPITLEVARNRFSAIADEMGSVLRRTSLRGADLRGASLFGASFCEFDDGSRPTSIAKFDKETKLDKSSLDALTEDQRACVERHGFV